MAEKQNKKIKFEDIKESILESIRNNPDITSNIREPGGVTLVDGFINQPIQKDLTGGLILGGPSIPIICLVGNSTGRMYFFALKVLLPDINI
jgi:hypothetical protein